jgi:hypothetical protein
MVDSGALPVKEAMALAGVVAADPGGAGRQAASTLQTAAKLTPALLPVTGASLSGRIGQQREP